MRIRSFILILLLSYWMITAGSAAAADNDGRIYKMTAAEAREVVSDWLQGQGFAVINHTSSDESIELLAEKDRQSLRIRVQRHSPLAARVQIEPSGGAVQSSVVALQHYLDGYINFPNSRTEANIQTIPDRVLGYHKAVVCIYAAARDREVQITGVIVGKAGLILCTGHDLNVQEPVSVLLNEGREISGRVVKIDRRRDLALIQVDSVLETEIPLQNGRFMLQNGDRLYALTCPGSNMVDVEPGYLDGPPRRVAGIPLWQVQMHVAHGSSGSPVFDSQGRMAAMVKGRFRGTDSVGFLIPFEIILQFLEKY